MRLKFKNRIAFFNTLAAAISTLLVFAVVYGVVYFTAYQHLDEDIRKEKEAVFSALDVKGGHVEIKHDTEWEEREHNQVEVNPTFIQITDGSAAKVFQSENLKGWSMILHPTRNSPVFFDSRINAERIRQGQFPIQDNSGAIVGHLSIGVSQVESALVLQNLLLTLLIIFPIMSLLFFGVSSLAASKSIAPIHQLIEAAQCMDEQTINTRLPLPARHDEIYKLAATINELLARIEKSITREKQISADISHELRTPLTGIRGTLEVLLRKRRVPEQYEQKLELVLQETDRMNKILEQLLQLSRLEAGAVQPQKELVDLKPFFEKLLEKWQPLLDEKQTVATLLMQHGQHIMLDTNLFEMILANLLSNALKYGRASGGKIVIEWHPDSQTLTIQDNGPGIPVDQVPYIFDRFYRSDASRSTHVPGTGLGLSIAKKLAELQNIHLSVESTTNKGTCFKLQFEG